MVLQLIVIFTFYLIIFIFPKFKHEIQQLVKSSLLSIVIASYCYISFGKIIVFRSANIGRVCYTVVVINLSPIDGLTNYSPTLALVW